MGGGESGYCFLTDKRSKRASCFNRNEALPEQKVLKASHFSSAAEDMLLPEAILSNEKLIAKASQTPIGFAVGKDASLETRHNKYIKNTTEKAPR